MFRPTAAAIRRVVAVDRQPPVPLPVAIPPSPDGAIPSRS
jgi:hypothetical protein